VWWRIGSSATLDTTTSFIGNIFALTDIAMNTGATLNGRVLAQTGQVTLDSNTITGPICALPPEATPTTAPEEEETPVPAVSGLPDTGGAPIRNNDFPWSLVVAGGFSAIALLLGVRAYRGNKLPKQ
jgi:type VI secretion system secreted protein VgrG